MFPGWDEPAFRTPYDLSVTVPAGQQSVGNMPEARARDAARRQRDRHLPHHARPCPPICSSSRSASSTGSPRAPAGTEVGVVTRRGAGEQGRWALESAAPDPALVQRLFRHALSAAQARQCRRPGQQPVLRRDGELGRDLHLRERPARRPGDHHRGAAAGDLRASPRTKWPTNGSATSSPWPGGTISG